jgi:excisionase family DNA binding protein
MSRNGDRPVPIGQAAEALGVSRDSLRRWANGGLLPEGAVILTGGGHRRFRISALEAWMLARVGVLERRAMRSGGAGRHA